MLKYSLRENLLTPAPDDYMAQMADVRSVFENIRAITASLRKNKCSAYTQYACALFLLNSLFLPRLFSKKVTALCKYMRQIQGANKKHPQAYLMYVEDCFLCSNAVVAHRFAQEGGVVQLTGNRLKFDAKDAAQGIFFIPETGEAVRATVIAENKPARLMAIIPAGLKAGTYYIEVRTKIDMGGKKLKTLKTGRFAKPLTVTA